MSKMLSKARTLIIEAYSKAPVEGQLVLSRMKQSNAHMARHEAAEALQSELRKRKSLNGAEAYLPRLGAEPHHHGTTLSDPLQAR